MHRREGIVCPTPLCEVAARDGRRCKNEIVLDAPPSAEEFAMSIGATRQSVSTIIAELIRDRAIRRLDASAILIADIERLKQMLEPIRTPPSVSVSRQSTFRRLARADSSRPIRTRRERLKAHNPAAPACDTAISSSTEPPETPIAPMIVPDLSRISSPPPKIARPPLVTSMP